MIMKLSLPQGKLGLELEPNTIQSNVGFGLRIRAWNIQKTEVIKYIYFMIRIYNNNNNNNYEVIF